MSINTIARCIGALLAASVGFFVFFFEHPLSTLLLEKLEWSAAIAFVCALVAFVITPYVTIVPYRWVSHQLRTVAVSDLIAGTIGLIVGLLISVLFGIPLGALPENWGHILPVVAAIICGYLGAMVAVLRKSELAHMFQSLFLTRRREREEERERERERERAKEAEALASAAGPQILLDTSAIIDGRIADISQTGFIFGKLVVPRFVLNELQRIADSADTLRRNRGRHGLEMLNRLQKDATVPVEIMDTDMESSSEEVDSKLVKLARALHCPIITNDFNLNRVAELQGVKVLNINELANAVKPVLLPGEEIAIKIMQDGKELGQGVGYLDDGTMIVVEGGRQYMNMTIEVTVTRVIQTVAGRLIFAYPKQSSGNSMSSSQGQSTGKQRQG
ncbi:MAG: PIN domain nuclease [Thermogemmatispora sp.]|uniref:PIN/TRAM domain-containing protein n=1 Tax=Thermogemmatispora sp. TaxID=1968838 RepID=UPI00261A5BE4|nr:PIN domain-containing protein [Thermogemmatispora sp.]MBX5458993.1 PIN domain nuclease [Thermogemmatispora sp.]